MTAVDAGELSVRVFASTAPVIVSAVLALKFTVGLIAPAAVSEVGAVALIAETVPAVLVA